MPRDTRRSEIPARTSQPTSRRSSAAKAPSVAFVVGSLASKSPRDEGPGRRGVVAVVRANHPPETRRGIVEVIAVVGHEALPTRVAEALAHRGELGRLVFGSDELEGREIAYPLWERKVGRCLFLCNQRGGVEPVVAEFGEVLGSELEMKLIPAGDDPLVPPVVVPAKVEKRRTAREAHQSVDERLETRESFANAKRDDCKHDQQRQADPRRKVRVRLHGLDDRGKVVVFWFRTMIIGRWMSGPWIQMVTLVGGVSRLQRIRGFRVEQRLERKLHFDRAVSTVVGGFKLVMSERKSCQSPPAAPSYRRNNGADRWFRNAPLYLRQWVGC